MESIQQLFNPYDDYSDKREAKRVEPAPEIKLIENLKSRQESEQYAFRERMGVLDEAEKETIQEGGKPIGQKEPSSFSLDQLVEIQGLVNSLVEKRVAEEIAKINASRPQDEDFGTVESMIDEMNDDVYPEDKNLWIAMADSTGTGAAATVLAQRLNRDGTGDSATQDDKKVIINPELGTPVKSGQVCIEGDTMDGERGLIPLGSFDIEGTPELFKCVVARAYEGGSLVAASTPFNSTTMTLKPTWDWVRRL